jgi:DNA-binding winged helix-turn-helix (wHTH) protein
MSKNHKHFYEFGNFRIDVAERTLTGSEGIIALTPKAFDTLLLLVENSGRVLGKQELMEKVWPESYVEENNLAQNISALRKALGRDGGDGAKYIETVPKRGYRFRAEVRETWDEAVELIVREQTTRSILIEEDDDGAGIEDEPTETMKLIEKVIPATARVDNEQEQLPPISTPALREIPATAALSARAPLSSSQPASARHAHRWKRLALVLSIALVAVSAVAVVYYLRRQRERQAASAQPLRTLAIARRRHHYQTRLHHHAHRSSVILH